MAGAPPALVWTSDQAARPFRPGKQFSAMLPVGDQVITLTATDRHREQGHRFHHAARQMSRTRGDPPDPAGSGRGTDA